MSKKNNNLLIKKKVQMHHTNLNTTSRSCPIKCSTFRVLSCFYKEIFFFLHETHSTATPKKVRLNVKTT